MSYPLGSSLIPRIGVRRERWPGGYDLRGVPLVQPGAPVEPDQPVIRLARSEIRPALPYVPRLSLPSAGSESRLPGASGSHALSPNSLLVAGLRGLVVGVTGRGGVVIEGQVAIVSGALGAGRQVTGPLIIWQAQVQSGPAGRIPPGAILVVPGPLNLAMLQQAINSGIAGVVASSISSRDFESFVRTNLIDLLRCANVELLLPHLPPLTVMLTEGLGTIAMPTRTLNLLDKHQGKIVLLSGATALSAGIYPELLISLTPAEQEESPLALKPETELAVGALVRVCSGSYEGVIGQIDYLFSHNQRFPSGIHARAARVRLEDGSQLVVPLPVLERIG
ncbi:MAG TPA: hypothetical protein VF458_16055 [Ktedonobacteraceae bacterium]